MNDYSKTLVEGYKKLIQVHLPTIRHVEGNYYKHDASGLFFELKFLTDLSKSETNYENSFGEEKSIRSGTVLGPTFRLRDKGNLVFERGGWFSKARLYVSYFGRRAEAKDTFFFPDDQYDHVVKLVNGFFTYCKRYDKLFWDVKKSAKRDKKEKLALERERKKRDAEKEKQDIALRNEQIRCETESEINEIKSSLKSITPPDTSLFNKSLRENSELIDKANPEYLQKLIRLKNYVESEVREITKVKQVWCSRRKLGTSQLSEYKNTLEENKVQSNFIVERHRHLNRVIVFGSMMIQALKDNDKFLFYDIYEKLDNLGILQNTWEKQVKEGLDNIGDKIEKTNTRIEQLMYVLKEVEGNIVAELQTLETSLATEIRRMDENLDVGLRVIDSSIQDVERSVWDLDTSMNKSLNKISNQFSYSNMLSTYNTYQLYKIRKG
jgi:hypothetical protein